MKHTTDIVKTVLETDEAARNSDSYLYFQVLKVISAKTEVPFFNMTVEHFLLNMKELGAPPFESVRRARQKVQQECPWLSSNRTVERGRMENERTYREYARSNI